MNELEKMDKLFSSIDDINVNSQRNHQENMKTSNTTDDKTIKELMMVLSYVNSQEHATPYQSISSVQERKMIAKVPLAAKDMNRPLNINDKTDKNRFAVKKCSKQSVFQQTSQESCLQSIEFQEKSNVKANHQSTLQKKSLKSVKKLFKEEVQSIIFDSKAEKRSQMQSSIMQLTPDETRIKAFKQKIIKINQKIDSGVTYIEKMIKQFKLQIEKAQQKSQTALCDNNVLKNKLCESTLSKQEDNLINHSIQQSRKERSPSKVELKGSFHNKLAANSQQYVSFVNRLSIQIKLDMQFTQASSQLARHNLLPAIKQMILANLPTHANITSSFFDIESAEMDPLQKKPLSLLQLNEAERREEAYKLYSKYLQIEEHYQRKLHHTFSPNTISLLLEEVSSSSSEEGTSITVGDLLSYLNMRTSSSFRNRSFVKMMKRLGLKPNGRLSATALQHFTRKTSS